MKEIIFHLFAFFGLAIASGLFFPVFYTIIGAPDLFPHPIAGAYNPNVQVLRISKPSMIFRGYGKWLCRKQNEFEEKHDRSRIHAVKKPEDPIGAMVETSYGRTDVVLRNIPQNEEYWGVVLLPQENALLRWFDEKGLTYTENFLPIEPNFDRARMPLSIYKALGLCNFCTVFWFMLFSLVSACFLGIFPAVYFFFIPAAYGLAIWASQRIEI